MSFEVAALLAYANYPTDRMCIIFVYRENVSVTLSIAMNKGTLKMKSREHTQSIVQLFLACLIFRHVFTFLYVTNFRRNVSNPHLP